MFLKRILNPFSRIPFTNFRNSIVHNNKIKSFSSTDSKKLSEFESIKVALEADTQRRFQLSNETNSTEKRLLIGFTCKKCQNRTHRTMSHHAYHNGIVLIECSGCQSRHLIADNLGWFKDTPNAARKIEDMTADVGEIRRKLELNEEEGRMQKMPFVLVSHKYKPIQPVAYKKKDTHP